ncbi:hypothetical protein MRX96_056676 [Rhipicephalus microplus]
MDVDEAGTGEATDHRTEQTRSISTSEDEDADSVADGWIEVTRKKRGCASQNKVGHPLSSRSRAAADPDLAARIEDMEKENRELRQELVKAIKQNEKSTRKIEELQQKLNAILKRMGGHPAETPSSGASSSHGAADERDTTSAVVDGDMVMDCVDADNHTQEPKRA